jgi:hypothetical protein
MTKIWNVSVKVPTYKLPEVVERLSGHHITVQPQETVIQGRSQLPEPNPKQVPKSQRKHYSPKPKAKKEKPQAQWANLPEHLGPEQVPISARPGYKRPRLNKKQDGGQKIHRGLGWLIPKEDQLQRKAIEVLLKKGIQPFRIADLIRECEANGSNKPAVYRAIWLLMAEGNVVRVEPGLYQRTGQSFNQSLFDAAGF